MPCAKEEALAIGRTVIPTRSTQDGSPKSADIRVAPAAWIGPARVVARRMAMLAMAAFAILVLLPAAVAAQAVGP
jgi:hypothetical protein